MEIAKRKHRHELEQLKSDAEALMRTPSYQTIKSELLEFGAFCKTFLFPDLERSQLFSALKEEDQLLLIVEAIDLMIEERVRLNNQWVQQMRPWAIRLAQLVIEKFSLQGFEIDHEGGVSYNGKTSYYVGNWKIPIHQSFVIHIHSRVGWETTDSMYPYVFSIEDKKQKQFSMISPSSIQHEIQDNIQTIQSLNPRKHSALLKIQEIEKNVWEQWHHEMRIANVTYQPTIFR